MPGFSVEVPHQLGQDEAVTRLKDFLDTITEKYQDQVSGMEGVWEENSLAFKFKTYGFAISGTLGVEPDTVKLDGQLPFAAMMFKGKIEASIRDAIVRRLS